MQLGVVGSGRIAHRFIPEAGFVSGISITAVYNPRQEKALQFCERFNVTNYDSFEGFLAAIDAVYIASPHLSHYEYIKRALMAGKHVLCEIPMVLDGEDAKNFMRWLKKSDWYCLKHLKPHFARHGIICLRL